jgi:DNA-binding transcriptional regulator YdaS (Cro superfamily)
MITTTERKAISAKLGVSDPYLYQCLTGRKAMSPEQAVRLEMDSGRLVTRRHLRPNDWWLIWPELVTDDYPIPNGSAPVPPPIGVASAVAIQQSAAAGLTGTGAGA